MNTDSLFSSSLGLFFPEREKWVKLGNCLVAFSILTLIREEESVRGCLGHCQSISFSSITNLQLNFYVCGGLSRRRFDRKNAR
jgi:hypothetical protein